MSARRSTLAQAMKIYVVGKKPSSTIGTLLTYCDDCFDGNIVCLLIELEF